MQASVFNLHISLTDWLKKKQNIKWITLLCLKNIHVIKEWMFKSSAGIKWYQFPEYNWQIGMIQFYFFKSFSSPTTHLAKKDALFLSVLFYS